MGDQDVKELLRSRPGAYAPRLSVERLIGVNFQHWRLIAEPINLRCRRWVNINGHRAEFLLIHVIYPVKIYQLVSRVAA